MQSRPLYLLLVAFLTVCYSAPDFANVGRPRFFLREFRGEKRTAVSVDIEACLKAHNQIRALHDAKPLTWDPKLAQDAQKWADHLANDVGQMQHAMGTGEGENLYWSASSAKVGTCVDAVKAWSSEEKDYPFNHPPQTFEQFNAKKPFGHFTQEVWKDTKKVGVAIATRKNGKMIETFVVARYYPPGNMLGKFENNVE